MTRLSSISCENGDPRHVKKELAQCRLKETLEHLIDKLSRANHTDEIKNISIQIIAICVAIDKIELNK